MALISWIYACTTDAYLSAQNEPIFGMIIFFGIIILVGGVLPARIQLKNFKSTKKIQDIDKWDIFEL